MPLGRFVKRIVVCSSPGRNTIRSFVASERQAAGSAVPCAAWGDVRDVEAVAHDRHAAVRHRLGPPRPVRSDAEALGLEAGLEVGGGDASKRGVSESYISAC